MIAFDIDARASLKQHLFVSYKIWDAHGPPFIAAYPLDDAAGNRLQFIGGRPISFVLR